MTRTPRHASVFRSARERRSGERRVLVEARAKVNLGLEVLGRRADGYHTLSSLLWAIDLADRVTLEKWSEEEDEPVPVELLEPRTLKK